MEFRIGDQVKIKPTCTIGELAENKWNHCHNDTLEFFDELFDMDETYTVIDVSKRGNLVLDDGYGNELYVNHKLFYLVAREPAKKMTLAEISKELGYEVEIVK